VDRTPCKKAIEQMIVRQSVFPSDPWGDGGARRTAQIGEILDRAEIAAGFLVRPAPVGRLKSIGGFARVAGTLLRSGLPLRLRREPVRSLGCALPDFRRQLSALPGASLLLWEGTYSEQAHLVFVAREAGVGVIGLPHNLESLVPGSCSFHSGRSAPRWFEEEIRTLAACDAVFAISREDQWLLRVHGIPAGYLPYYPPAAVENFLLEIQAARRCGSVTDDLLLLGTAVNPPTLAGMLDRVDFFRRNSQLFGRLHIAGFGTERLCEAVQGNEQITLHGAVDQMSLRRLLVDVRAAVIHQQPTSGALTRIPELLLAGIPVFANVDAARSCFGTSGVKVYENDNQLAEILSAPLPAVVAPARDTAFEQLFIERIRLQTETERGARG